MSKIPGFHIHARPEAALGDALLQRYRGFPVANVSDAMSRTTGTSALRPFHRRQGPLVGRALTVRTRPGDNLMVHQAIVDGRGKVKVGDGVWMVTGPDSPVGTQVRVVGLDGVILKVETV
mgnify:CR=1 FL=1